MDKMIMTATGGYSMFIDRQFAFLQDAWANHINALARVIPDYANSGAILQGCERTSDGGNDNVAAGVMLWKGEVVLVDAHTVPNTGTLRWWLEESDHPTLDPMTMHNGTQQNVHKVRRCKMSNSLQTGEINEDDILDLRTSDWFEVDGEFDADYSPSAGGGVPNPRLLSYRKRNGYLEIQGICNKDVDNNADRTVFTLPVGYRPNSDALISGYHVGSGAVFGSLRTNGIVSLGQISGNNETIWLDLKIPLF